MSDRPQTTSQFSFLSPGEIEIGGERIFIDHGDNDAKFRNQRRADLCYMAKSRQYLEGYKEIMKIGGFDRPNIFEIGIFAGGSAVFFDKFFSPRKLVSVDLANEPAPALERYREAQGGRVVTRYGVDQSDKAAMRAVIEREFDGQIDLVVDDASHFYEPSRASFEACFPYLRPGGLYVIEDWAWVHSDWPELLALWKDYNALTNLVLRIVMAHGTDPGVIPCMGFRYGMVWIQRGRNNLSKENFSLESYERPRGKELPII